MTDGGAAPVAYESLFRLDGRTVAVIGAGAGIGRECAIALAAHGAAVVCCDVAPDAAEQTARLAGRAGSGQATAYPLDVLAKGAVERAAADLGPLDGLVHTPATNVRKRLLDYTAEDFDRVVALNLRGTFDVLRAFGRPMAQQGRGSIVVFSSIRSRVVEPGQGVYAATKAGVVQLVRTAAAELGAAGVRVNAVAPGVVATALTQPIRDVPSWADAYAQKNALGRWARPDELVGAVVFLISDAASYVTGSQLMVDGGWTAIDGRFTPPG